MPWLLTLHLSAGAFLEETVQVLTQGQSWDWDPFLLNLLHLSFSVSSDHPSKEFLGRLGCE